jgi:uncharacterized protein YjdB
MNSIRVMVRPGQQVKLVASAMNAISNDPIMNASYRWRSDAPRVTVDQSGLVTAVSEGIAHVFASLDGVESDGWPFTVHFITSIEVTPSPVAIRLGATQQFGAVALDPAGIPIYSAPDPSWRSGNASIATIDPISGKARGVGVGGPIAIVASIADVSGSAQVTVTP